MKKWKVFAAFMLPVFLSMAAYLYLESIGFDGRWTIIPCFIAMAVIYADIRLMLRKKAL